MLLDDRHWIHDSEMNNKSSLGRLGTNEEEQPMKIKRISAAALGFVAYAVASVSYAQWSYTEDFEADPACGEGQWLHRFEQDGGGVYTQGDYCMIPDRVPQDDGAPAGDGQYLNLYTNYGDGALMKVDAMKNLGGFGVPEGGGYPGNAGNHIFSACVYVPATANNGAEFDRNVDVGMCLKNSGNSYAAWPGDGVGACTVSKSFSDLARGSWQRVSVPWVAETSNRVDAGFYITHNKLDSYLIANGGQYDRYPHTAVYIDEMYVGLASEAPTTCAGAAAAPVPAADGDPNSIPVLPLGGLLGLIGLIGLMGLRRKL